MQMLLPKLMRRSFNVVLCSALLAGAAQATGSDANYPNKTMQLHGIAAPMDMPRPKPLNYVGTLPVQIEGGPEQIYKTSNATIFSEADLNCMAEALYFEARGESRQGQAAVAEVILNRLHSGSFPNSICGVINQQSQFSYTIGGKKSIRNKATYMRVRQVAEAALSGQTGDLTNGATYFHTPAVRPAWSRRFERTVQIGRHIFYRTGGSRRVASN